MTYIISGTIFFLSENYFSYKLLLEMYIYEAFLTSRVEKL